MENISKLEILKQKIEDANTILIVTHVDPDGDAVGSSLALYNYLKNINKDVDVMIKKCPATFMYLPRIEEVKNNESQLKEHYDLLLIPDCGDKFRVAYDFESCKVDYTIVIDHHITHVDFGEVDILDADAPAACQILYNIFDELSLEISCEVAQCIYTGILTDTGGFRYSNVNPRTFEIAMRITQMGINIADISRKANDIMSHKKFELLKLALNNLEFIEDKIAYLYLSKQDMGADNTEDNIHEGIVNYGRDIENIEVSIVIREIDKDEYKVSMRSNDYVDVATIAKNLGGGGHTKAAGVSYKGDLNTLKELLLTEIKKVL